jgi:CBS domain-containing protein
VKARDIMVTSVITVDPDSSVRQAASTLYEHRISALPVVDEHGELIGIVSEGDLMRRAELDTDYRRSWWLELFSGESNEEIASEYVKSHGRRVRDVMTREVITAEPGTALREILNCSKGIA